MSGESYPGTSCHKRRSSSPCESEDDTCSSPEEPQNNTTASASAATVPPFTFTSAPVSPLTKTQSARGQVRRRLSDEGDSVDARPPEGAPSSVPAQPVQAPSFGSSTAKRSTMNQKQLALAIPGPSSLSHTPGAATALPCPQSRLAPCSSSAAPLKAGMGMRRRASLPRLNLAVANKLAPAAPQAGLASAAPAGASRLLDSFSATTNPNDEESFPYANGPIEVAPGLFLGAEHNANNGACLRKHNIGAVLNVAKEVTLPYGATASDDGVDSKHNNNNLLPPTASSSSHTFSSAMDAPPVSASQRIRIACSTPDLRTQYSNALKCLSIAQLSDYPESQAFPALSYYHVPLSHDVSNLAAALPNLLTFIARHLERGIGVLIHCQCGVSRSASVAVAWVMQAQSLAMHAAYDKVKDASPYISPNISLLYQLIDFEKMQRHSPSGSGTTCSTLGSEEGDDDLVRTPPDDAAYQHPAQVVDGLLSPALADRLAFSPVQAYAPAPLPTSPEAKDSDKVVFAHPQAPASSRMQRPVITRRRSEQAITSAANRFSPLARTSSDAYRSSRSNTVSHPSPPSMAGPPLASPAKPSFNLNLNLSTVPETGSTLTRPTITEESSTHA